MRKINVIITNSLGELDVVLPIFAELNNNKKFTIKIIFINKSVFKKFRKEQSYVDFCEILKLDIKFYQLFNKFDYKFKEKTKIKLLDIFIWKIFKIYKIFSNDFFFLLNNISIISTDIIMNDGSSNELKNSSLDFILFKFLRKKNYVYHHGHSLNQVPKNKSNIKINLNAKVLSFHNLNFESWEKKGYNNITTVGFPKFFPSWINLINNYKKFDIKDNYIVIYSRAAEHKFYMNKENYKYLLISSYKCIRQIFPNYKIFIKVHPREELSYITEIIKDNSMKNIEISYLHSGILAKNAKLTISFWSSTILDSLSLNIPSIEFYKEHTNFRILEPNGSLYKLVGIHSASSKIELLDFMNVVKNNKYKKPKIIEEFKNYKNLEVFNKN